MSTQTDGLILTAGAEPHVGQPRCLVLCTERCTRLVDTIKDQYGPLQHPHLADVYMAKKHSHVRQLRVSNTHGTPPPKKDCGWIKTGALLCVALCCGRLLLFVAFLQIHCSVLCTTSKRLCSQSDTGLQCHIVSPSFC